MSGSRQQPTGFWTSLWQRWAPWAEEQEQRQERQAVRETGAAQDGLAERVHEQKVRRRDLQSRMEKEETAGKALKTAGGPNWQAKATPHVKRALALRKQLAQINAVIDNLETQLGALADVASTVDVVDAMRDGAQQMSGMLKQVGDVDDIADVLADVDDSLVRAPPHAPPRRGGAWGSFRFHLSPCINSRCFRCTHKTS